jgi:hypothetical protein
MTPLDLLWHVLGFFAPAAGLALVAPTLAKVVWRREMAGVGWLRLVAWVAAVSAGVLGAGLVLTGHDGMVVTYAALVVGCAATLWFVGLRRGRAAR